VFTRDKEQEQLTQGGKAGAAAEPMSWAHYKRHNQWNSGFRGLGQSHNEYYRALPPVSDHVNLAANFKQFKTV